MSEIQPAMTPEEWADLQLPADQWGDDEFGKRAKFLGVTDDVGRSLSGDYMHEQLIVLTDWRPAQNPHALAAALLFRQPFGFTWAMVDAIRRCSQTAADEHGRNEDDDFAEQAADHIAALLPPRVEP